MNATFEAAVEAIIAGDLTKLSELLAANPNLAKARSARVHRATLLHYVSANGVEDERQSTPKNAAEIAKTLIAAGSDVDATFLDGKSGTTPLVSLVTSVHPHNAGVAADLVKIFVDAGAKVEGLNDDGEPLRLAIEFGYAASAEALIEAGASINQLQNYRAGSQAAEDVKQRYMKK
ncbi:MAG: hypothetical protein OXP71_16740 [Candidatus Poribacteria bacterium]|nr:hypothetical protein [Candidatus Poribacteria bacterium]